MIPAEFMAARKALGMTQAAMGQRLGLTKRQVRNLEKGKTPIREAYAQLIGHMTARPAQPGSDKRNDTP